MPRRFAGRLRPTVDVAGAVPLLVVAADAAGTTGDKAAAAAAPAPANSSWRRPNIVVSLTKTPCAVGRHAFNDRLTEKQRKSCGVRPKPPRARVHSNRTGDAQTRSRGAGDN